MTFASTNLVLYQQHGEAANAPSFTKKIIIRHPCERDPLLKGSGCLLSRCLLSLPHSAPLSGHCEHSWRQWWFCKGRQTCCLWKRLSKKRLGGFLPSHFNQQQSWWHQRKRWFYPHHGWVLPPNMCILGSIANLQQSHWEYSKIYINITCKYLRGFASLMFDYVTGPRRIRNTDDLPSPLVDQLAWPQGTPGGL